MNFSDVHGPTVGRIVEAKAAADLVAFADMWLREPPDRFAVNASALDDPIIIESIEILLPAENPRHHPAAS